MNICCWKLYWNILVPLKVCTENYTEMMSLLFRNEKTKQKTKHVTLPHFIQTKHFFKFYTIH